MRYADDCNVYVASARAGERVMANITRFLERRLRLQVNVRKSVVAQPRQRAFLGFSFTGSKDPKRRLAPETVRRFRSRVRKLTRRTRGISVEQMTDETGRYLLGWRGYFGYCETPSVLGNLGGWIRRRLRAVYWQQWKRGRRRYAALRAHEVGGNLAATTAGSSHGPWRIAKSPALSLAFPNADWDSLGLPRLDPRH